jgi:hypothetical protein
LTLPKKQKGADVLLEIATLLQRQGLPVHFLLAGPRRHWIRRGFQEHNAAADAELRMRDVRERHLAATLESAYEHVRRFNSDEAMAGRLKYIYEQTQLSASPKGQGRTAAPPAGPVDVRVPPAAGTRARPGPRRHQAESVRRVGRKKSLTFALWNEFKPPPYGGGNQFMIALEDAFRRKGMQVARMGTHDRNARHMPGARWQIAARSATSPQPAWSPLALRQRGAELERLVGQLKLSPHRRPVPPHERGRAGGAPRGHPPAWPQFVRSRRRISGNDLP